jgi:hypothetical protein
MGLLIVRSPGRQVASGLAIAVTMHVSGRHVRCGAPWTRRPKLASDPHRTRAVARAAGPAGNPALILEEELDQMKKLPVGAVLAMAIAAVLAAGVATPARAEGDHGNKHGHSLVVKGVITHIEVADSGRVLTIDRGEADDDPADNVLVRVTADTKIEPKGVTLAEGQAAKAVVKTPADDGGVYTATNLEVEAHPDKPGRDPLNRPLRACGTIKALPADPTNGEWTISVPDIADVTFLVNDTTKIQPKDAKPAVGDVACVLARHTDTGWVAEVVELKHEGKDEGDHEHKAELRGKITALTAESMTLDVPGRGAVVVALNADTEVEGTLAVDAEVVVRAKVVTDSAGNESLLALKVKVVGDDHPGGKDGNAAVHLEGKVTDVTGDVWTISHDGTDTKVTVNDTTKLIGLDAGADPKGREVMGVAKPQQDGTLLAVMLNFKHH